VICIHFVSTSRMLNIFLTKLEHFCLYELFYHEIGTYQIWSYLELQLILGLVCILVLLEQCRTMLAGPTKPKNDEPLNMASWYMIQWMQTDAYTLITQTYKLRGPNNDSICFLSLQCSTVLYCYFKLLLYALFMFMHFILRHGSSDHILIFWTISW
jgi:hypothetical protein